MVEKIHEELFGIENLYLKCTKCNLKYDGNIASDESSIEMAVKGASRWRELSYKDKDIPNGISGCPNVQCSGELVLKSKKPVVQFKGELVEEMTRLLTILEWIQ